MPADPAAAHWPAVAEAGRHDADARVPLVVVDGGQAWLAGSVALAHLPVLARWPEALRVGADRVSLWLPAAERSDFLAQANRWLQAAGLVIGWRDESYPLRAIAPGAASVEAHGAALAGLRGRLLARLERAAARFWGSTSYGAHANGYVADADGRPGRLWIARRAFDKPTNPGRLDNLVGGGVPLGQHPADCVRREGWEEAGLLAGQFAGLRPGRRIAVMRDIPEGLQRELLFAYDLALPPRWRPHNRDGEVHSHALVPVADALACAAAGEMTVDAALVTLDFALRHRLLAPADHRRLAAAAAPLWRGRSAMRAAP